MKTHYIPLQPFTHYFPRADIHELISPDILHQLIKGAFKDHIVTWINTYMTSHNSERQANLILDDIDRRYTYSLYKKVSYFHLNKITGLLSLHRLPGYVDFQMAVGSSSGQVTTLKR